MPQYHPAASPIERAAHDFRKCRMCRTRSPLAGCNERNCRVGVRNNPLNLFQRNQSCGTLAPESVPQRFSPGRHCRCRQTEVRGQGVTTAIRRPELPLRGQLVQSPGFTFESEFRYLSSSSTMEVVWILMLAVRQRLTTGRVPKHTAGRHVTIHDRTIGTSQSTGQRAACAA